MQGLHCLIWVCLFSATQVSGTGMLRFSYKQNNKILLTKDETWEVGAPNMMAVLDVNSFAKKYIYIKISLDGEDPSVSYQPVLMHKCNQSSASYDSVNLTDTSILWVCTSYFLTIGKRHYQFDHRISNSENLELRICILYSGGNLCSNSLFVWNLCALINPYEGFLTDEAVEFLKLLNVSSAANKTLGQVNFLVPRVSKVIKTAPAFLRSKMKLGVIFGCYFLINNVNAYARFRENIFVTFVNYLSLQQSSLQTEQNLNQLKLMYLDIDSGVLHYSVFAVMHNIAALSWQEQTAEVCGTIAFAGDRFPFFLAFYPGEIDPNPMAIHYQRRNVTSNQLGSKGVCEIPEDITQKNDVTIFSGIDATPIVCPIICSEPNVSYKFTRSNADEASDAALNSKEGWTEKLDEIKFHKTGNVIKFPETVDSRHVGQYKCEAGGKSFTFNVQVVAMPSFVSTLQGTETSGSLPPVIYAMEAEFLTYSCTSYYNNVTVKAEPVFFSPTTLDETWRELNLTEFNSLVSASGETSVSVQSQQSKTCTSLTITIKKVPSAKGFTNFTHRFACKVSVDSTDALKIGMPSYQVHSDTNVFYIPRPTSDSFDKNQPKNCFEQPKNGSCISAGAEFSVALKPQLTRYLKEIGVEVLGLFKIDDSYLTDIGGGSNFTFDSATNRLTFKVHHSISETDLEKLSNYSTLRPIFNLKYPKGRYDNSEETDLRDCLSDLNCFYSTEFDISSSLQSIVMMINSEGSATPIATGIDRARARAKSARSPPACAAPASTIPASAAPASTIPASAAPASTITASAAPDNGQSGVSNEPEVENNAAVSCKNSWMMLIISVIIPIILPIGAALLM